MNETCSAAVVAFLIAVFAVTGFFAGEDAGFPHGQQCERDKAIKAGVGWYSVNQKTGETEFVYGVPETKQEHP